MSVDLFGALGLDRCCSQLDVKQAFRRAALRLHPDRARLHTPVHLTPIEGLQKEADKATGEEKRFALAARAYEVLVDPRSRALYEAHGDASLPPFHGDPQRTFRKFFGTDNPFLAQLRDRVNFDVERPDPPETVTLPLRVSLQEIDEGVTKTCTAAVRVPASPGGDATTLRERSFTVEVEPGAASGTRYAFRCQGHQDPGRPAGDVELVLEELEHERFRREGADLVHRRAVSLRQALAGCTLEIRTLDDRLIRLAITDIVRPGYEKRLRGEGLPLPACGAGAGAEAGAGGGPPSGPGQRRPRPRGDLVLRLDVLFPAALSRPCRALLDQALQLDEQAEAEGQPAGAGPRRP
ncbi:DnaJ-like protein subfamily B member 1, partial [Frankliniella fusca]